MAVDKKENRKKQFFTSILILIMALAGIFTSSQEVLQHLLRTVPLKAI